MYILSHPHDNKKGLLVFTDKEVRVGYSQELVKKVSEKYHFILNIGGRLREHHINIINKYKYSFYFSPLKYRIKSYYTGMTNGNFLPNFFEINNNQSLLNTILKYEIHNKQDKLVIDHFLLNMNSERPIHILSTQWDVPNKSIYVLMKTILDNIEYFKKNKLKILVIVPFRRDKCKYENLDFYNKHIEKFRGTLLYLIIKPRKDLMYSVERKDIVSFLNMSKFTFHGSISEGGSKSIKESLCCGCIPIVHEPLEQCGCLKNIKNKIKFNRNNLLIKIKENIFKSFDRIKISNTHKKLFLEKYNIPKLEKLIFDMFNISKDKLENLEGLDFKLCGHSRDVPWRKMVNGHTQDILTTNIFEKFVKFYLK